MPYYTDEAIEEIGNEFHLFQIDKTKRSEITELVLQIAPMNNPKAVIFKFAYYGILRRLKTMEKCVENVFNVRSFYLETIPTDDELSNWTINLQCFLIHLYGTLENLAWVYAISTDFKGTKFDISFFANKKTLLKTLPQSIQEKFMGDGLWIDYVKKVRDFLAHQEPFYIPPYSVNMNKEKEWRTLEEQKTQINNNYLMALWNLSKERKQRGRISSIKEISDELKKQDELEAQKNFKIAEIEDKQKKYTSFHPMLVVDTNDNSLPIMQFYPQILVDIKTIYEKVILILEYIVQKHS